MKTEKINLTSKYKWSSLALVAAVGAGLLVLPVSALAVQGQCSNCHTMHNSQNDDPMAKLADGSDDTTPNELLLIGTCYACHTGDNTGFGGTNAPFVNKTTAPTYGPGSGGTLAGGNFFWVGTDQNTGHNVLGLDAEDTEAGGADNYTPPGGASLGSQLTCAGTTGCHGDRTVPGDMAAISGAHHGNGTGEISGTDTNTVGGSYRFLKGVEGYEDDDYEYTVSDTDHNQYKGVDRGSDVSGSVDSTTISSLCAGCHNAFHNDSGPWANPGIEGSAWGSPWVRHPTDFDMNDATGTEYANYGGGTNEYQPEAPVGSADISSIKSTVLSGSGTEDAIVLCVSCHRAHGSPYDDLLRWNYSGMSAGGGTNSTGCFNCHTTKDDGV